MSSKGNPVADWASVNDLMIHLRSSFFSDEFDFVAKALTDREDQLVSDNVKLNDELKVKENEIVGVMKVSADVMKEFEVYKKQVLEILKKSEEKNAEYEKRIRAYEKRSADDFGFKMKAEKEKKVLVLEKMKLIDELETKRNEIDEALKVNAEHEWEIAVHKKRVSDDVEFIKKAVKEKMVLVLENLKLNEELETKRNEIDLVRKVNAEYERKIGVFEKRVSEILEFKRKAEEEKELLVSKNLELNEELETKRNKFDLVNAEYERKIGDCEKRVSEFLEFKRKAEEEKELLVSKNLELFDELKTRRDEIDAVMKVNAENEGKIRDYETRYLDELAFKSKAEEEKELLALKNLELNDELKARRDEIDAVMKVKAECEGMIRDYEMRYLDELAFKLKAEEEKEVLVLELKARRKESAEYEREFRDYKKRLSDELELRTKAEEEKGRLVSVNLKLNDELKTKEKVIDEVMKVNAEFEEKSRVYEKRSMDDLELKKKAEEEKELLVLENMKLVDELKTKQNEIDAVMKVISEHGSKTRVYKNRSLESEASESDRKPPLVSEKKDSKRKTEVKLPEIIDIDDDDDDVEFVPENKRRQVLNEKTELRYLSRLCNTCRSK